MVLDAEVALTHCRPAGAAVGFLAVAAAGAIVVAVVAGAGGTVVLAVVFVPAGMLAADLMKSAAAHAVARAAVHAAALAVDAPHTAHLPKRPEDDIGACCQVLPDTAVTCERDPLQGHEAVHAFFPLTYALKPDLSLAARRSSIGTRLQLHHSAAVHSVVVCLKHLQPQACALVV